MATRRSILLAGVAVAVTGCGGGGHQPSVVDGPDEDVVRTGIADDDWPTATPASQGVSAAAANAFLDDLARITAMRGVVVIRNGMLIAERYYGDAKSSDLRHVRSSTKTVTGLLTAQAIAAGKLPGRQTTLSQILPAELAKVPNSGAAAAVQLDHVLNMSSGLKWNEDTRSDDLFGAKNVTALALSLPADVYAAGTVFNYDSAVSHLPSTMLQNAYGMDMQTLAKQTLFAQLGIKQVAWANDASGTTLGSWGLQMRTRDLAKLAWMGTKKGEWQGKQLVPAQWFTDVVNNKVNIGSGTALKQIGYQSLYWTGMLAGMQVYMSWGFGGQFGMSIPELNMAIATHLQWNLSHSAGDANANQVHSDINRFLTAITA